jgi:Helix-hairpin-helix containing domain/Ku70/Ku80 beta-barrel domain
MVFLHSHGVGTARAVRIFKTYGADAIQVMTENPYRLARDIRGIGFKTADAIAMKLGIEKTAMIRVRAGISYALTEAMHEGHCGLPTEELIPLAEKLLVPPQGAIGDIIARPSRAECCECWGCSSSPGSQAFAKFSRIICPSRIVLGVSNATACELEGYLRLSLVSCPIALYPASSLSEKVSFNRINRKTGNRLKQQNVDSETGEVVSREDMVRGYEVAKDRGTAGAVKSQARSLRAGTAESTQTSILR